MSAANAFQVLGAAAGLLGPFLFFGVLTVEGWLRPHYSQLSHFICALGIGPRAWISRVNSIVSGVLRMIFAGAMQQALPDSYAGRAGFVLLMLIGICSIGLGLFPVERRRPLSAGGKLHLIFGIAFFGLIPVACFALAYALAADPLWKQLSFYTFATGVATLLLFIGGVAAFAVRSRKGGPPRVGNMYGGLIQRLGLGVFLIWQVIVALTLWHSVT